MRTNVESSKQIEWSIYPKTDEDLVTTEIDLETVTASTEIMLHVLSGNKFRMQQYVDASGNKRIGYGIGDASAVYGYTEKEAYSAWLEHAKERQRVLKKQLPLLTITQSKFDALFSLFMTTGNWRKVTSPNGVTYDILSAINQNDWDTVADMIANGADTASITSGRLFEAKVLQLGDYSGIKPREWLRNEGIQYTRKVYSAGTFNETQRRQAEIAYYKELDRFLPSLSEVRKRAIIKLLNQ